MKISLCAITGNEEPHVLRFLASFKPCFDELCLVRAIGSAEPDGTLKLARKWCAANGKAYREGEYKNSGDAADWPHVDDFARARAASLALATGDLWFWADLDDTISDGVKWRAEVETLMRDGTRQLVISPYAIPHSGEHLIRERVFRVGGPASWVKPIHENVLYPNLDTTAKGSTRAAFIHEPTTAKVRDPERNLRILRKAVANAAGNAFDLHREYYMLHKATGAEDARSAAFNWANFARNGPITPEQRYVAMLNQAEIAPNLADGKSIAWEAFRLYPNRRDALYMLAEHEIADDLPARAVAFCEMAATIPKPPPCGYPMPEHFYGWCGRDIQARAYRAARMPEKADSLEVAARGGNLPRLSVLHATRRPQEAIRARTNWMLSASEPQLVEWIFAIDEGDAEAEKLMRQFRHVKVVPNGCVAAWNAAAAVSTGAILVQMSDDWTAPRGWDTEIAQRLDTSKPQVLAISDGTRRDSLLCMAILTRARYEQQGHLFHPDYRGVFSDDEFTVRAYADGVVVPAPELVFQHNHPAFGLGKTDAVYAAQNSTEAYAHGWQVFSRRNPAEAKASRYDAIRNSAAA